MFAALLVCAAVVLAAAAPGVALAVGDLSDAQDRVTAADTATRATVLVHDLADERDDLAASTAAGHHELPAGDRARTDAQARDLAPDATTALRTALATLPAIRKAALAADSAQDVVTAYQPLADSLGRAAGPVTAPLGRAVGAASVQRGLLVAGLTADGGQRALVTAARTARLQEQAALADFRAVAPADLRARYDQTVTGADADQAEHDLDKLLGGSTLTSSDRDLGVGPVKSALTARIGLMRGVETSATTDEQKAAASHRDHTVTVLELRAALAGLCLILLAAVLVTLFRGLTRPLAALYRWSRSDAESGQGADVVGSDEFAAVARRVNALTQEAQALRTRAQDLTAERTASSASHRALAAEHKALLHARTELLRTQGDLLRSREEIAGRLSEATERNALQVTYVNLSLRTLGLVERQLALIEGLEEHEQEPDRLATLFRIDHLATRMRRNNENLLVLTGTEHSHGAAASPILLVDVARAAVSEIEQYERVRVRSVPEVQVAGRAADDVAHLVAELLDNATVFSAPTSEVEVSGWVLESGEVVLSVEDTGVGVPAERLAELNDLLVDPNPAPPGAVSGMGLYVVARLARRHGVRVRLRHQPAGGTAAVVALPQILLREPEPILGAAPTAAPVPGPREPEPVLPLEVPPGPFGGDVRSPEPQERASTAAGSPQEAVPPAPWTPDPLPPAEPFPAPAEPFPMPSGAADPLSPAAAWPGGRQPEDAEVFPSTPAAAEPLPPAAPGAQAYPSGPSGPGGTGAHAGGRARFEPGHSEFVEPGRPVVPSRAESAPLPAEHARAEPESAAQAAPPALPPVRPAATAVPAPGTARPLRPLPQRVPRATGVRGEPADRRRGRPQTPVNAEELRRKLSGLQSGLRAGRKDAEAEVRGDSGDPAKAAPAADTVEEGTR